MVDAHEEILREFASLELARQYFPMWTEWGIEDESHAVHSLGLSYLLTIGQALGHAACCEYPVAGHLVRADCVWWDKKTREPVALFEFERHKGGGELVEKVRNLMLAWHHAERKPRLLGLVFWTKNFYPIEDGGIRGLWRELERGFEAGGGSSVPPVPARLLRVFECLHVSGRGSRHVLKGFEERRRT
jgi:hypothetical protein